MDAPLDPMSENRPFSDEVYFTREERIRLVALYRSLCRLPQLDIPRDLYRQKLSTLVESGCFARDEFGYNGLVRQLEVALIVAREFNLGNVSVSAVLFYRSVYKGFFSLDEIAQFAPEGTAALITRMRETAQIYMRRTHVEESLFRELLLSVAEDVRVLLLIIADRLYRMRTAKDYLPEDKRREQAEEVNRYFIPLTHKLGLYAAKGELEDLYLKYTDPTAFYEIKTMLGETKREREEYLQRFVLLLRKQIDSGTKRWQYEVKARTKSISSIHNKMHKKGVSFDNIFDLTALRIIIDAPPKEEHEACWYCYSLITDVFAPDISRLRDWITHPKDNGYESLQITVEGPDNRFIEVQIRTRRMDEVAERGVAAHWRYKGLRSEGQLDSTLTSVRQMLETKPDESTSGDEQYSLGAPTEIYVFTPRGELKKLPPEATVLDFAFAIHSNVGAKAVAAQVNGKNVALRTVLHNGDTVSITTSRNQYPREDWLQIVVSSSAKNKIRQKLRERSEKGLSEARSTLERRIRNRHLMWDEGVFNQLTRKMGYAALNDFFRHVAEEKIDLNHFLEEYQRRYDAQYSVEATTSQETLSVPLSYEAVQTGDTPGRDNTIAGRGEGTVVIVDDSLNGVDYALAQCCNPQFGDAIIAYPSRTGIRIHRKSCPNVPFLVQNNPDKILPAEWSGLGSSQPKAHLYVEAVDSAELLSRLVSLVKNSTDVKLLSYNIQTRDGLIDAEFTIQAPRPRMNALRNQLATLSGVHAVRLRL